MSEVKKIEVEFGGKSLQVQEVADGVVRRATRKSAKSYLVRCKSSGKWCYCSDERHDKLLARFGSEEAIGKGYISREAKKLAVNAAKEADAAYTVTPLDSTAE